MLTERRIAEEQMDAADLDAVTYARVLTDLGRVNRITLAARPTLGFLGRALGNRTSFRLLDVGFGDGGMLRSIARWAERRGMACELVGIDLNAKSAAVAQAATGAGAPIRYLTGDYADLAGERFDCVISSLVAHHMTKGQMVAFLRFMEAEAVAGWFVNDALRHGFAYLGYPWLARIMGVHRIVREDGQLSIARSYRAAEWLPLLAAADVPQARVFCAFPFRLCVERLR
ncbi:methyltransferase domain-containing protein [Sphingomonas sp. ID0503]|uniref:methyltransferase domain-containing protein n=1 Tax=Sphingomonas sp. ID0503 TaxID=3399691 RepID=UPI003AFA8C27